MLEKTLSVVFKSTRVSKNNGPGIASRPKFRIDSRSDYMNEKVLLLTPTRP